MPEAVFIFDVLLILDQSNNLTKSTLKKFHFHHDIEF